MSSYTTLAEARGSLKIKWYRTALDRSVLKELTRRSNAKGLLQAVGHLLLYVFTGAMTFWLWSRQVWIGMAIALWFHGAVTSFFHGTATHELNHKTVFKTKALNVLFLYLFSLLGWWNHVDYASSHKHHHMYTLYPDADRENVLPLPPVPGILGIIQLLTVNLFTLPGRSFGSGGFLATVLHNLMQAFGLRFVSSSPYISWLNTIHEDDPEGARISAWWARLLIMFHGAVIVVGVHTGLWIIPLLITLAPFIANVVSYSVSIAQHSGMKEKDPDFRKVARSMKLGPVLTFLYWRMNWHCEHHMYAAVPCYNLRKLAKEIEFDLPKAKGFVGTWKEMLEIQKNQKADPSYQFDRPLPSTATNAE